LHYIMMEKERTGKEAWLAARGQCRGMILGMAIMRAAAG
jgi:hypothetical protein